MPRCESKLISADKGQRQPSNPRNCRRFEFLKFTGCRLRVSVRQSHLELTPPVPQDRVHTNHRAHHAQRNRDTQKFCPAHPPKLQRRIQSPFGCRLPTARYFHSGIGWQPGHERQCLVSDWPTHIESGLSRGDSVHDEDRGHHGEYNTDRTPSAAAIQRTIQSPGCTGVPPKRRVGGPVSQHQRQHRAPLAARGCPVRAGGSV